MLVEIVGPGRRRAGGQEVELGTVSAGMLDETVGQGPSVIWPSSVWAEETTARTAETTPRTAPLSIAVPRSSIDALRSSTAGRRAAPPELRRAARLSRMSVTYVGRAVKRCVRMSKPRSWATESRSASLSAHTSLGSDEPGAPDPVTPTDEAGDEPEADGPELTVPTPVPAVAPAAASVPSGAPAPAAEVDASVAAPMVTPASLVAASEGEAAEASSVVTAPAASEGDAPA